MSIKGKKQVIIDADEREGLLAEYKTLRDEILVAQGRRLQTVSLTVGIFGVIFSIVANTLLGTNTPIPDTQLAIAIGGGIALYGIVIPGLIMTANLQRSIQRIGSYIRIFIEPRIQGLNWENRLLDYKKQAHLAHGMSGIGGIYFFLSLLPLSFPLYVLSQNNSSWYWALIFVPFTCWSLCLSYDMQAAVSKGWKGQWQVDIKQSTSSQKAG
jgi:hypothetical protein